MRKILTSLACLAFVAGAGVLGAQANESHVSSKDSDKVDSHDRPIGSVTFRPPPSGGTPPNEPPPTEPEPPVPAPPSEGEDIPPTETPPTPPPPEDPPTYYGEPVEGQFAFLLDASGSMGGSRIATVRAETSDTINDLTDNDEFDAVAYGSQFNPSENYSVFMWGELLPATEGNKSAAIDWVNGPTTNPGGGTPTYACLQASCALYPASLTKMFLLTDGSPNVSGSAAQILSDFPAWWEKFDETTLVAICIGGYGSAQQFMQQLAALAGGVYVAA